MTELPKTSRTTFRRLPDRGTRDRAVIDDILDSNFLCHVGYDTGDGPRVVPTLYARSGDVLYLHGSSASSTMRTLGTGTEVCVTVTELNGLVFARTLLHHSINYRSVMVFGVPEALEGTEKDEGLRAIVENAIPGRWPEAPEPTERDMKQTSVLRLPIAEASAKVRTGPPKDDPADRDNGVWAGVLPLVNAIPAEPVPDEGIDVPVPPSIVAWRSRKGI